MRPTVRVRRRKLKKLPARIGGPLKVKVGFPAGKTDGGIIDIAVWNHYGTRGGASGGGWGGPIPERPFLANAMRDNKAAYRSAMKASAAKILRGETGTMIVLSKLGILAQGDIQQEITDLDTPPNSPVTIARKGSSNPLIDTGRMRGAVTYKVDD